MDNTERPETIEVGSNMLAGTSSERIFEATKFMVIREKGWVNPSVME
jgi:UDP-N-acetylglucosamine 2-epimerase (non-hydrolysing)